ncbi:beta-propeller domain-containing protein, partial [Patescibacteria group bacterium]
KNSEVLAKIEFKSRPSDIYINGDNGEAADRLVIYGHDNTFRNSDLYKKFRRRGSFTFLKVFDISDKSNPKQVRDLDFEGTYNNSRMIGDYVYFVTSNHGYYYIEDEPILPRIIEDGEVISNLCEKGVRCIEPDIYYFDIPYSNYNFTAVNSININEESEPIQGDVYLLSGNQNMYVSLNNIYITYTKYISEYQLEMEVMKELIFPRLSSKDKEKILSIESVPYYILTPDEKRRKVEQIIERFGISLSEEEQEELEDDLEEMMKQKYEDISKELEKTVIHKIGIKKGELEYKNFGEVTGQVLNQFSMDENNGYFRIATTKNRTWSRYDQGRRESYNNLYVLDDDLKVVGSVEELAEGERIFSVRFMQNRAYMVTFRQTDPLFVIDLSNPENPKVLGKLKIPGFSNYLHPYDNDTLIGIGKDTSESEWGGVTTKGLKLSLFDVTDVSDPKEIDTYVMGDAGSDSIALHDHKAFLFSRDKNLLVIPVSIRESFDNRSWGNLTFSGAAVFYVDSDGFELKGKIDHSEGGKSSPTDYWRGYNYYDNTVKRSLYIDDVLYTFSNNFLLMHDLEDVELEKSLKLKKLPTDYDDDFTIIN